MNPDRHSSRESRNYSYMATRRAQGFPETFPTPSVLAYADNWLAQNKSHALLLALTLLLSLLEFCDQGVPTSFVESGSMYQDFLGFLFLFVY